MCLMITLVAAVISTVVWYTHAPNDTYKVSTLCFLYWGASIMWMIDAVFEYSELHAEFFNAALADVANDTLLGLAVVVLGLVAWLIVLLMKDPHNVLKRTLLKK